MILVDEPVDIATEYHVQYRAAWSSDSWRTYERGRNLTTAEAAREMFADGRISVRQVLAGSDAEVRIIRVTVTTVAEEVMP